MPKKKRMPKRGKVGTQPIDPKRLATNARIYHTARDAAEAMGMSPPSFIRACMRVGVETPFERKVRQHQELCDYYGKKTEYYSGRSLNGQPLRGQSTVEEDGSPIEEDGEGDPRLVEPDGRDAGRDEPDPSQVGE